jgi:hypothetical protein
MYTKLSVQLLLINLEEVNPEMVEVNNGEHINITFANPDEAFTLLNKLLVQNEEVYREHFNANLTMIEFLAIILNAQIDYAQTENSFLMLDSERSRTLREKLTNVNRHLLTLFKEYRNDELRRQSIDMMKAQFFSATKSEPVLNGFINTIMSWTSTNTVYVLSDFDKIVISNRNKKPILYSSKHKVSFTIRCDKHSVRVGSQLKHIGIKRSDTVIDGEKRTAFLESLELIHKPK